MKNAVLLDHARQLVQLGVVAAIPLQAMATVAIEPPTVSTAQLQPDYSAAVTYSNSGFFTGELDESAAQASTFGLGFKLSGTSQFNDSQLYNRSYGSCSDGVCDASTLYYYNGDTDGTAFIWGGRVTGDLIEGDQLKAAYEFSIDWTHTRPPGGGYDYADASWSLTMGFANMAYADPDRPIDPRDLRGNLYASSREYGYMREPGLRSFSGEMSVGYQPPYVDADQPPPPTPVWYWYVQLGALLSEAGPPYTAYGAPAPANINGDYLRLVVPQNSIDIGVNAIPSAVPEPQSWAMLLAGLGVALWSLGRRRQR